PYLSVRADVTVLIEWAGVEAGAAFDIVGAAGGENLIVAGSAVDDVVAAVVTDRVVPDTHEHGVGTFSGVQIVCALATVHSGGRRTAEHLYEVVAVVEGEADARDVRRARRDRGEVRDLHTPRAGAIALVAVG